MKKSFNLIFQVHQPYSLRRYRFFDIGNDHYYYDDYSNESITNWLARKCYLPACSMLLRKIVQHKGNLKVSFYMSGITLMLFRQYAPSVIESFRRLAETGNVEFICGTWSHSLASLKNKEAFLDQVGLHRNLIKELFGQEPVTFCNSELIYSDEIGAWLYEAGFRSVIAEGGKPLLGWRTPNMLYSNAKYPGLKLVLRNKKFSDELSYRFSDPDWSEYRNTPVKFVHKLENSEHGEQVVNLYLDFALLGAIYQLNQGIFTFFETFFNEVVKSETLQSSTPGESVKMYAPASVVSVPYPVSWAGDDSNISAWNGNEIQQEALNKLFALTGDILKCGDNSLIDDWNKLQVSDHFYYMSNLFYARELPQRPNPYQTPHEAFVNYMNILSDLRLRLEKLTPITDQDQEIRMLKQKVRELENDIEVCRIKLENTQGQKNNLPV